MQVSNIERIHVENNVILTTKDEISVQQMFNYLTSNLDQFRVGSEFVVVCGVHGTEQGQMHEYDEDFRYDYEAMFNWCNNERHYKRCAPRNAKPFHLIKERKFQMGHVVEVSSEEDQDHEGKYNLDEKSKLALKSEFISILGKNNPVVIILAICWSHLSEMSDILSSAGLYSVIRMIEERAEITTEKSFRLDDTQINVLKTIVDDHYNNSPWNLDAQSILLWGSHGTGKTILLTEILLMRLGFYKQSNVPIQSIIVSCFNSEADDYVLLGNLKNVFMDQLTFEKKFRLLNFKSLCDEFGVEFIRGTDIPLETINCLIEKISNANKESKSILFLDEIFVKNDDDESSSTYDWSGLELKPNVDILLAANPQGRNFKQNFEMSVGNVNHLHHWKLLGRHRNSLPISTLLDHYKSQYENINAYIDGSNDIINESELPPGNIPIWIQKGSGITDEEVLKDIKRSYTRSSGVTLLYHDDCIQPTERMEFISGWCQDKNWKFVDAKTAAGCEDEFVITYDFPPGPEHISRARNGLIMVTTLGSSFKHFDLLMSNALNHENQCKAISNCHLVGKNLIDHKIIKNDNISVDIQKLKAGAPAPAAGSFVNQPGNPTGPLDNLLNFGRSNLNFNHLLKTFSTLGTTGKITTILVGVIALAMIGGAIVIGVMMSDSSKSTTIVPEKSTTTLTTTTTIPTTTPIDCDELSDELNELAELTTNNISAWNTNVQHGKWFYPDPDPDVPDKWETCEGDTIWYGWEGEHGTAGVISTVLNATGYFTISFGNCGNAGSVTVLVNEIQVAVAGPGSQTETENVNFDYGDKLSLTHTVEPNLDNDSFSIIQFVNINLHCNV